MNGILRGCGLQFISVTVTLIAYYVVALPIGIPLMLKTSLGLKGKITAQKNCKLHIMSQKYYFNSRYQYTIRNILQEKRSRPLKA